MKKFIKEVKVTKLFGHYNYDLKKQEEDDSPLLIVYGDNGSGKTTVLKLMFFLLSTLKRAGHKGQIARTRFEKFSVEISDGTVISAEREGKLVGGYKFIIKNSSETLHSITLETNSEGKIRASEMRGDTAEKLDDALGYIENLGISIHYLSDDRELLSSVERNSREYQKRSLKNNRRVYEDGRVYQGEGGFGITDPLEVSFSNLVNWIRRSTLRASRAGERNMHAIYSDLIESISGDNYSESNDADVENLLKKIVEVKNKNKGFVKLGLVGPLDTRSIEGALQSSEGPKKSLLHSILIPYVDGVQGRLNALGEIQNIVDLFINTIEGYFSNKSVIFNAASGFKIKNKDHGDEIQLNMLSSGERQLLLLFCDVITASDKASIFIIDEPEISLNIKWQRKLIDTLMKFSPKGNVQFIFATHSFELLSGNINSVCKLEEKEVDAGL